MDIRQMQYLLTLAEYRSFTKASKALFISQPSLSAFVAKAEAELGVTLFDRSTNPLTLTYAGEVYIEGAEAILNSCELLQRQLSDISSQKVGRIRIGLPYDRAAYMLPLIMPEYKQMYPKVTLRITTASSAHIVEQLLSNHIDMAILPNNTWSNEVTLKDIYLEELVLVANEDIIREEHLVEGVQNAVDLHRLKNIPLITLSPHHGIRAFIDNLFSKNGIRPNIIMETTSNITAYRLATAGLGATIVPRMTIELTKGASETPVYSLTAVGKFWNIVVAHRRERDLSQLEKDFITTARRIFLSQ